MIDYIEKECNFEDAKPFFRELFTPYKREQSNYTSEQIEKLTKLKLLQNNPYIDVESVVVYISNKGISFDDQETIEQIMMQDILTEVDNEFG